ncbi:hypothetical protein LTR05_001467 [Lithohypha guttulata]|uniref:BTB domain-containing protein n=1 Tax=Lithohypha guttulata TaxID=1690604 RepID=A0AAN7T7U5_9EURO|nr:hypothetical protein LTR05_001467 [Lithohypha guttulata]
MNSPVTPQPQFLSHMSATALAAQPSTASWSNAPTGPLRSATNTPTGSYLMPTTPAKPGTRGGDREAKKPMIRKSTGQKPACLVNASVTYCGNDQIYAFGGFDQFTDEVYNHVLRLDLKSLNWALVDNYGDIPGVRMGHSASLYQGDKLLVYGGENEHREYLSDVVILDLKTHHWTQPEVHGVVPKGRARHAAVVYEDKLFIIGGLTGETNYILDDICYLDLKTWTWSKTWTFVQRFDHTAWVWGGRLWVFGGLGMDMERSSEIWWLDLKGSSASRCGTATGRMGPPLVGQHGRADPFGSHPRTESYTANSTSVHIRSRRGGPTAPGAISTLRFLSGPYVPMQNSGTHFHVCSSGALLDFVSPAATIRHSDCNLSTLELDSMRWQKLVEGPELFGPGYKWHYCTMNEDGTKVWLLGSPTEEGNSNAGGEQQLSEVLSIDLRRYGLLGNDSTPSSEQNRILAAERISSASVGLGQDLAAMFDQPPNTGSMVDFEITAETDGSLLDDDESDMGSLTPVAGSSGLGTPVARPSYSSSSNIPPPIHVHKFILQARWPHFKRLLSSKMLEYQTNKLHIPEPYSVVRAFLYYLYTDDISSNTAYCRDLGDVAGMLVLANLYDMPKLRLLCVNRLSREIDTEHAAVIWERAGRTEEEWLKNRAARFCMMNWGRVVRTDGFRSLSRTSLMELCEVVDTEGRVVGGEELDDGFNISAGYPGANTSGRRRHRDSTTETEDGVDDDDVDMN